MPYEGLPSQIIPDRCWWRDNQPTKTFGSGYYDRWGTKIIQRNVMSKVNVAWVGVWAVVALLCLGVVTPPTTKAAAVADPEPCCGRLAAGALGFAGGYLIGRHRRHRCHRCGCGGCGGGCGGCGGGCGWCGGGWYGRKRRSLDEMMEQEKLEDLYWKITSQDNDQCGLRLVCELAQKDPNYLSGDETVLLLPYRGRDESDETTYYGRYDKAVWHGQKGNPCHKMYPTCVLAAPEILVNFKANFTDPFQ
ncbi:uncharacterized protein LOC121879052 isoform X1 [Homarus americanus]|uniref:uncharacterized protein LOC121879052 isoform X1 n=1 Tax=Homarus americanus TaxID=6706 RepID=UPI001C46B886|nr:uncharacterized protein LOC121879052 isoform X1 [Homarus americanus]